MKSLTSFVAIATMIFFLCTSFSADQKGVFSSNTATADNIHYHFYLNGGTTYDGWYTTSQEIDRLELMYGVLVDTSPLGGSLLASGYAIKGYPHLIYASVFLYGH